MKAKDLKAEFIKNVANATNEQILAVSEYPEEVSLEDYRSTAKRILEKDSDLWWINNMKDEDLEMFTMRFEDFDDEDQADLDYMLEKA